MMIARARLVAWAVAGALLLGGCGRTKNPVSPSDAGLEGGPRNDALASSLWEFVPEDDGAAQPVIALKQEGADPTMLSMVARGVGKAQGVAFRLTYDPQHVQVQRVEADTGWGSAAVSRFISQPEGELWAGIGLMGATWIEVTQETAVAHLQLLLTGEAPLTIGFRPLRNLILSPDGAPVQVTWLGGTYKRRGK
jgi:hypothetical protein